MTKDEVKVFRVHTIFMGNILIYKKCPSFTNKILFFSFMKKYICKEGYKPLENVSSVIE